MLLKQKTSKHKGGTLNVALTAPQVVFILRY